MIVHFVYTVHIVLYQFVYICMKSLLHTDCHSSLDIVSLLFWLPPAPVLCITVITVKQAFGNLGLLAGYGAKPIGAGLGRDRN